MRLLRTSIGLAALLPTTALATDTPITQCTGKNCLNPPSAINLPQVGLGHGATIILNIFALVTGILSVIFLVLGGIKYSTSEGDSGKITSAKNTITYAILGLIVSILAPVIVSFVIGRSPQ